MQEDLPNQNSIETFVREMSPQARAMLAKAMQDASDNGDTKQQLIADVLYLTMKELGEISPQEQARHAILAPVEPFVVNGKVEEKCSGIISRISLERIWQWLSQEIAIDTIEQAVKAFATSGDETRKAAFVDAVQEDLSAQISGILSQNDDSDKKRSRLAAHLGGGAILDELKDIALILKRRKFLASMAANFEEIIKFNRQDTFFTLKQRLETVFARAVEVYPFVLVQARAALRTPQSFLRFITFAAESLDDRHIEQGAYGHAFNLLRSDLHRAMLQAKAVKHNGDVSDLNSAIKTFGAIARALASELNINQSGRLGRQLSILRNEIAETIRPRLTDIVPRVHRLARPRAGDKASMLLLDPYELESLSKDISILIVMRSYAEETALSAVTTRAWSELRDVLETGMPALLERLRAEQGDARQTLLNRLNAVVNLCEQVFGAQYAQVQRKAVEIAAQDDPRARRA
jgi:hypothetical protein